MKRSTPKGKPVPKARDFKVKATGDTIKKRRKTSAEDKLGPGARLAEK